MGALRHGLKLLQSHFNGKQGRLSPETRSVGRIDPDGRLRTHLEKIRTWDHAWPPKLRK